MFLNTVDIHYVLWRNYYHNIAHVDDQESVRGEPYLGLTFVVVDLHHTHHHNYYCRRWYHKIRHISVACSTVLHSG